MTDTEAARSLPRDEPERRRRLAMAWNGVRDWFLNIAPDVGPPTPPAVEPPADGPARQEGTS